MTNIKTIATIGDLNKHGCVLVGYMEHQPNVVVIEDVVSVEPDGSGQVGSEVFITAHEADELAKKATQFAQFAETPVFRRRFEIFAQAGLTLSYNGGSLRTELAVVSELSRYRLAVFDPLQTRQFAVGLRRAAYAARSVVPVNANPKVGAVADDVLSKVSEVWDEWHQQWRKTFPDPVSGMFVLFDAFIHFAMLSFAKDQSDGSATRFCDHLVKLHKEFLMFATNRAESIKDKTDAESQKDPDSTARP